MRVLHLLIAAACAGQPTAAAAAEIGRIRAHLLYENSGRLSDNILAPAEFIAWNTIIGEGSAEEPANDMLVLVEVVDPRGGQQNLDDRLTVSVRSEGRVLASRTMTDLLTEEGRVWKGVWMEDAGCAGPLEIEARIGNSVGRSAISLDCGE